MNVYSSTVCPVPNLPDVTYDGPIRGFTSGTILGVACKERFLEASPSITCKDGQWSYPEPPCKRKITVSTNSLSFSSLRSSSQDFQVKCMKMSVK